MHLALAVVLADVFCDFRDVRSLVADALHVGNHLKCSGDHAEVACHRLLFEQQLDAKLLDFPLFLVDFGIHRHGLFGRSGAAFQKRPRRKADGLLAQCAHFDELHIEQFQLLVELVAHYPNLPVM